MFSSRRSRNRHSANPNPKLHLPQTVRRKLPDGAGGLGLPDSATGEFEEDDEDETGSTTGAYPGSPMSLSSQYALQCAAAAAGSVVHQRQIVLDDDDDEDDEVASNHSTAMESASTVPEDTFVTFSAAATAAPSTPSSETALNLVCSPRSSSSMPSTGSGNVGQDVGANEPETGAPAGASAGQSTARGTSKRKSAMPTRCSAQQLQDDDLTSDENSSDVPAAKRRSTDPAGSTDALTTSSDDARPEKSSAVEPNNNKVRDENRVEETGRSEEQVDGGNDGSGTADLDGQAAAPRSSTPAAGEDVEPGSPNACSRMSDDISSIGSDDDRKVDKARADEQHGAAQSDNSRGDREDDVNDSGVVLDPAAGRDDEPSSGRTPPDATENGTAATAKDLTGQGSAQTAGFVCLVEGCNATFPSKRSRDRHSANLNLHRKLLSTSGSSPGKAAYSTSAVFCEHPFPPSVVVHGSSGDVQDDAGCLVLNLSRSAENPAVTTGPETRAAAAAAAVAEVADAVGPETDGEASRSSSVGPDDEPLTAGSDPTAVTCHVCPPSSASFRDKLALKEHLETVHPRETHRCTVAGCDKLFSTRKSRNRHSQNDNLHRHLVVAAAPRQ